MSKPDVSPCPFCARSMTFLTGREDYRVAGKHSKTCPFIDVDVVVDSLDAWNTRAAPVVEPVPPLIQTLHANGDRIAMEATIAQQAQRIADLEGAAVVERREPVAWGAPKTIRQLIQQLETLDQDLRPVSILRVPGSVFEDGKDRSRAVHLSISHERVEGQWLSAFKGDGEKVVAFWCRIEQPAPVAVLNIRNFANAMIDIALEGGNADGPQIQELAVEYGLLKPEQRAERCGVTCSCAEYADFPVECFRKVKELDQ